MSPPDDSIQWLSSSTFWLLYVHQHETSMYLQADSEIIQNKIHIRFPNCTKWRQLLSEMRHCIIWQIIINVLVEHAALSSAQTILKMVAPFCSVTLVTIYQTTWCHIPKDSNLHCRHYQNLNFLKAQSQTQLAISWVAISLKSMGFSHRHYALMPYRIHQTSYPLVTIVTTPWCPIGSAKPLTHWLPWVISSEGEPLDVWSLSVTFISCQDLLVRMRNLTLMPSYHVA
jgi:hypothetical protein